MTKEYHLVGTLLLLSMLVLAGCAGQTANAPEQGEKVDVEKVVAEPEKTKPEAEEITQAIEAAATVACSDFYGPQDAQAYYDTRATVAEKEALNPDGDEWACNEQGVSFAPEPTQMAPEPTGLQPTPAYYEAQCRMNTYIMEQDMDKPEEKVFTDEMADILVEDIEAGGDKDVNDAMDEMGVPAYEDVC